jgi:hypothetical protein
MQVRKLPYDGPKTHRAIVMRIHEEAQEQGKNISLLYIKHTVGVFFSAIGFPYHFKFFIPFIVAGLGRFGVTRKGRSLRKKLEHKIAVKERRKARKQATINRKDKQRYKIKHYRMVSHDKAVKAFNKRNEIMIKNNLKPWTWKEFCKLTNRKRFISWGTKPFNHYNWRPMDFLPLK